MYFTTTNTTPTHSTSTYRGTPWLRSNLTGTNTRLSVLSSEIEYTKISLPPPPQRRSTSATSHHCSQLLKVVFRQRMSFVKGRLPSRVVFHQRSSSVKGHLPSKVIFRQRLSSVNGRLPTKVFFHQRSSSVKGRLPSKVVFRQRWSSAKGRLPSKVVGYRVKEHQTNLTNLFLGPFQTKQMQICTF